MNHRAQLSELGCIAGQRKVGQSKAGQRKVGQRNTGQRQADQRKPDQRNIRQSKADQPLAARLATERGQTTAEYALVLLAAGSIAMLVVGWAQSNDAIGALFDTVLSRITSLMA